MSTRRNPAQHYLRRKHFSQDDEAELFLLYFLSARDKLYTASQSESKTKVNYTFFLGVLYSTVHQSIQTICSELQFMFDSNSYDTT